MVIEGFYEIPIVLSLLFILIVLTSSVVLSWLIPEKPAASPDESGAQRRD
jgi:hypothetical protein